MRGQWKSVIGLALAVITPTATVLGASSWVAADSLNRARLSFAAATLDDGTVLVAGGSPGGLVGATGETYDAGSEQWTLTANLLIGRSGHTLSALDDGRALAVGGNSASGLQASSELFDPGTSSWTLAAPLAVPRTNHSATVLGDGRVLVAGGNANNGGATNEVEIYDPTANSWSRADSLRNPRYNHSATLLADGRVLVAGGFTPGSFHTPLKTAEVYDPQRDSWSIVGAMEVARAVHAAALLPDGRVLVAGGVTNPPNTITVTDSTELFDPTTERWVATGSLNVPRRAIEAALLSDGTVLVAGGFDNANALTASAEVYNAVTGAWSNVPSMSLARAPRLVTLADGRVMAIASVGRVRTAVVEIFTP